MQVALLVYSHFGAIHSWTMHRSPKTPKII